MSVQAAVGNRTTTLTSTGLNSWGGSLSLDGLPRRLISACGHRHERSSADGAAQRDLTYDRLPVLTVTAPVEHALAQPDARVTAQCVDDGPTCTITVRAHLAPDALAVATGTIDTAVRPPDGLTTLVIEATDSTGRTVNVERRLFATSNPNLRRGSTFAGRILDVDAARVLVFDESASPRVLHIVNRTTSASEIIWTATAADEEVRPGFLTPLGAIFATRKRSDAATSSANGDPTRCSISVSG